MFNSNLEIKREKVIEFLKKNPNATTKKLKKAGLSHLERLFKKGLSEAYRKAGLNPPRGPKNKNIEERKQIIIEYIKKHPNTGQADIEKNTRIKIQYSFGNIKEAFNAANMPYPREENIALRSRGRREVIQEIIKLVKNNPETTFEDISNKLRTNPYKLFKNFDEIYKLAEMPHISGARKWAIKKRREVINYIKNNPLATQREINKSCKTKIQESFEGGIFEAYKLADINYPFERLKFHGTAIKEIKQRAKDFEREIAQRLTCYGNVSRLVKTKRGVADIILERKDKKIVIEVKDYLNKEISKHEVKQLNRYLEDINSDIGLIICHNKPKKDRFLMGKNELIILSDLELNKIPELLDYEIVA